MSVPRRRATVVGGIALVSVILAGWSIAREFQRGGLFAREVGPNRKASDESPPDNLPPFVVRKDGRAGKIQPIHLPWEDSRGAGGILDSIDGCLPAGSGVDVLWRKGALYVLKQKGLLKRVWGGDAVDGWIQPAWNGTSVCFDGKYVWAALSRHSAAAQRLIILDPQLEQTWEFGTEHGLPFAKMDPGPDGQKRAEFFVGPISPGRACIAAWNGSTQLADVRFDPKTGPSTKVFLHTTASLDPAKDDLDDPQMLKRTDLNFKPRNLLLLSPSDKQGGKPRFRLLISRLLPDHLASLSPPPLVVDPETMSVEVVDTPKDMRLAIDWGFSIVHDGALYWLKRVPGLKHKLVWARAIPPKLEEEWLLTDMAIGRMAIYDDRVCILGRICWLWQPGSPDVERVGVQVPWSSDGFQNVGVSSVHPRFEGKEYHLEKIYSSQHYGVLATAATRGGSHSSRIFQFGIASDPRLTPDSPDAPSRAGSQLAAKLPAGTSASELSLFAANSDGHAEVALGESVEADDDSDSVYPVLAREIVKQAVLIAARDELQWVTRDVTLRELVPEADEVAAKFLVHTQFSEAGDAQFWLSTLDDRGRSSTVWREKLSLREGRSGPLDYAKLAEAAERWSRETFPALLKQEKLTGEKNDEAEDAVVSPAAREWLKQMTSTAQFAVLRELHHAIRKQGESAELLGALVRAYANLGMLAEFHWTAVHKACKARALLYAQRLAAKDPNSASGRWHLAYAEALIGLHQRALSDLEAAEELRKAQAGADRQAASEAPDWVAVIDAYCRFDGDKLAAMSDNAEDAQLAELLQFFQVESMKRSYVVQELALKLLQKNPECYRLFDAMCESCAIGVLHAVTEMAPVVLRETIPKRLEQLSGLPPDTAELLKRRSIRQVGVSELSDSLLATDEHDDAEEFSWTILGGLLQEAEFIQIWRRAFFMRYQWSVPTDEFIAAVKPLAASHRFRPLIELCATSAGQDARRRAAEQLTSRLDLAELDFPQLSAFQSALNGSWQTGRPEQYLKAERRPEMHLDDVHRDLLAGIQHARGFNPPPLVERLMKVSPTSPDAVAIWIQNNRDEALKQGPELEKKFARHAQVWRELANIHRDPKERERTVRAYIKLSPDLWAYRRLTQMLKTQKRMDEWKAAIDEFLAQPEAGLTHAQMRVEVANYYMDRSQWKEAEPYAVVAAETWAEWAILCAIRCYQGLGDVKQETLWRSRVVERYPNSRNWLEWYVHCRWNGLDGCEESAKVVDQFIVTGQCDVNHANFKWGAFYQLSGRPEQALPLYAQYAANPEKMDWFCAGGLLTALVAQDLGDDQARDDALKRVASIDDPKFDSWKRLAAWIQASLAADPSRPADLDAARPILASETNASQRALLYYFVGRYLALSGQWDGAVDFLLVAAAAPEIRFSIFQPLACAALRDHGITPGDDKESAPPASDGKPSSDVPTADK